MICFSKLKKLSLSASLLLLALLFGSVIVNANNQVFALDDLVLTESASSLNISGSSYKYGIIYNNTPKYYNAYVSVGYQFVNDWGSMRFYPVSKYNIFNISGSLTIHSVTIPASLSGLVTVTFSDSLPSDLVPPSVEPPSGNIDITENGTYDVSSYAEAVVNVENEIIYGDYHDDLVSINNSILICAAVCLVLYFFYAIYRMIIKSTGGN